jgi:hypothetical protein
LPRDAAESAEEAAGKKTPFVICFCTVAAVHDRRMIGFNRAFSNSKGITALRKTAPFQSRFPADIVRRYKAELK